MRTTFSIFFSLLNGAGAAYANTNCGVGKMYSEQVAGCYCETDNTQCISTTVTCGSTRFKDTAKNAVKPNVPVTQCCANKAKCSTGGGICDTADKLKAAAASLYCAAGTCAASDKTTCCENDSSKCKHTAVTCGTGKYKDPTKDGTTAGSVGAAICCVNLALCSTMNCGAGMKQKCNAGTLFCAGTACQTNPDEATCCVNDEQKCKGMTSNCNANKFKDPAKYNVVGTTDALCCTAKNACTGYGNCLAGRKLITAHATTYCAAAACGNGQSADQTTCCVDDTAKCRFATYNCNANKVRDDAKYGTVGNDDATCCVAKQKCGAAGNCAAGMKKIANAANTYCAGKACTAAELAALPCCENDGDKCKSWAGTCAAGNYKDPLKDDTAHNNQQATNCCTAKARCDAGGNTGHTCAAGTKAIANALCATKTCGNSDASTCCETDPVKCKSVTCGTGQILKTATLATDKDARIANCCSTKAKCNAAGFNCPAGQKKIAAAANTECATKTCGTGDHGTCCENTAGTCFASSVSCAANRFKDPAKYAQVGTNDQTCCSDKDKCTGKGCAAGKKLITAHATTYCAALACTTTEVANTCCVTDTTKCGGVTVACPTGKFRDTAKYNTAGTTAAVCCTDAAKCDSLACSAGMKHIAAAATTYCAGATCTVGTDLSTCCVNDDMKCKGVSVTCPTCQYKASAKYGDSAGKFNCCTNRALCSTITCGAGLKQKAAHATTYCAGLACTSADSATCCENIAGKCLAATTVTCAAGKFKDPTKYGITGATAALCCSDKKTCVNAACPTGKKVIAAAATTYCASSACTTNEIANTCCENDPTKCGGGSVVCSAGKYKDTTKNGAAGTTVSACCSTAALCTTLTCPTALKQIAANTTTYCAGATCGTAADVATCCEANPALTACSATTSHKCGPAAEKDSAKDNVMVIKQSVAVTSNSGLNVTCCTAKATCAHSSMTCAAGKKKITAAATTYCEKATCGSTADHSTCCETDATKCFGASVTCATGSFKDPAKNGITGTTAALCCTVKAACSTANCPTGQKTKTTAGLTCAGAPCVVADQSNCCENDLTKCRGSCIQCAVGTFKDPAKYAQASPGQNNNAQGACCSNLQICQLNICAAGQKLKANAATTYCSSGTCSTSDRTTCCETDSLKCLGATVTCGTGQYKDTTKNGVLFECDEVAACCTNKQRCSHATCPVGKQLKENAYDLYCATSACGTADVTTCCDEDKTVCAGATVTCGATKFKDTAKSSIAVTDWKTKCCTARTKCLPNKPVVNATAGVAAGAPRVAAEPWCVLALTLLTLMALRW